MVIECGFLNGRRIAATTVATFAMVGAMVLGAVQVQAAERERAGAKRVAHMQVAKKKLAGQRKMAVERRQVVLSASVKEVVHSRHSSQGRSRAQPAVASSDPRPSVGQQLGLHQSDAPLNLNSNAALVVDQNTQEILLGKNADVVLPIASLTKLMTGLLVTEARLPLNEEIVIASDDVDTIKGSRSRLPVGMRLNRGEALHLALMASENRAAHALGRTYPGGLEHFVDLMNRKAAELGMKDTRFVEPTGLSSQNRSSARDLALLVAAAYEKPLLRDLSTSPDYEVGEGRKALQYRNTNTLVKRSDWDIGLQKTGYISEAGRCLVMQASVAGRQFIMVFLDAAGKAARQGDAERVRRWLENSNKV